MIQQSAACAPATWDETAKRGNEKFWDQAAQAPAWYVVEAVNGKEFELAVTLQAAFAPFNGEAELYHPIEVVKFNRRICSNGRIERRQVIRKISRFGSLLFVRVRLTRGLADALSHMPNALAVLRCKDSDRAIVIPDVMVDFYKQTSQPIAAAEGVQFEEGDMVRVIAGPAAGQQGVVERVDSGRSLRLDTSKFGGSAPIIIEAGHVELVVKCRRRPIESNVKRQAKRKRA
jgi:transcription antitermination factor NusG